MCSNGLSLQKSMSPCTTTGIQIESTFRENLAKSLTRLRNGFADASVSQWCYSSWLVPSFSSQISATSHNRTLWRMQSLTLKSRSLRKSLEPLTSSQSSTLIVPSQWTQYQTVNSLRKGMINSQKPSSLNQTKYRRSEWWIQVTMFGNWAMTTRRSLDKWWAKHLMEKLTKWKLSWSSHTRLAEM